MTETPTRLSVVIPVYNEQAVVARVISGLQRELHRLGIEYEVIVVNDGSTDATATILQDVSGIRLINHPYNKGNGASLKTGARAAKYEYLMFFDADGQHREEYIEKLIPHAASFDMVIGARQGYQGPWIRQPGKRLLTAIASYLVDFRIPDLTSGMRIIKRDCFMRFVHLYPDSFSLYTTITLSFLKSGLLLKYVPITINPRVGKSMVGPRHALQTFVLIIRIITLFSPMRFIAPISLLMGVVMVSFLSYDILHGHITPTSVTLFISTILIFLFGILLDQISAVRREIGNRT